MGTPRQKDVFFVFLKRLVTDISKICFLSFIFNSTIVSS